MEVYRSGDPRSRRRRREVRLGLPGLAAILLVAFLAGLLFQRSGSLGRIKAFLQNDLKQMVVHRWAARKSRPERIVIDIRPKNYEKLDEWQRIADEQWQITSDLKTEVPATVTVGDVTCDADVRLKGEWGDHVDTDKWSLRIKIGGGDTLLGMKRFSIQHPKTRSYVYEWVHHAAMRREDVIALRYFFLTVTINGRDMGVYALEEHFTKEMLEHNRRQASVIVKLNADFRYKPVWNRPGSLWLDSQTDMVSQYSADIAVYDDNKVAEDPALQDQFLAAAELLEAFRAREKPTDEVFDSERMARYMAISELMGTLETAGDWSDMRFYYNPRMARLEPISVEGAEYHAIKSLLGPTAASSSERFDFHALLFSDPVFFRHYVAALERVSTTEYVDELLADIRPGLDEELEILWREWPEQDFSDRLIRENARTIQDFLLPEKGIHAWLADSEPGVLSLELGTLQVMPVEILRVSRGLEAYEPEAPTILPGKRLDAPVQYRTARFLTPGKTLTPERAGALRVHYRILGSSRRREADVFPRPRRTPMEARGLNAAPNADTFAFAHVDEEARTIGLLPGRHVVDRDLVFPTGYTVVASPGLELDLTSSAMVVSRSPLAFRGTEDLPIHVGSSDGTGQGFIVLDAREPSVLEHVVFRNLGAPERRGTLVPGAVTFYRSPVEVRDCRFADGRAEDALNIVSTRFVLERCLFENQPSDAFDGDFIDGEVSDCTFRAIDGDGVDVSGSRVEVRDSRFSDIGDKAVSVGEESALVGRRLSVERARFGVASKDLSNAILEDLVIADAQVGLAVYVKKPEYGPASIEAHRLKVSATPAPYWLEEGSSLTVDGEAKKPNEKDLAAKVYAK